MTRVLASAYTVYDTRDGRILRTGRVARRDDLRLQARGPNQALLEGHPPAPTGYYVERQRFVPGSTPAEQAEADARAARRAAAVVERQDDLDALDAIIADRDPQLATLARILKKMVE